MRYAPLSSLRVAVVSPECTDAMTSPHDQLAKTVFSQLEHARSALSVMLPPAIVEAADWSTLVLVSGELENEPLSHVHTDLLYTVELASRTACIYVLWEHMSTVERTMSLRLLRYMVKVWSRFEKDHPGEPLPLIVPVVMHHSDRGWTAPTRFEALLDMPDALRTVARPFIPDFSFVLDDLSKLNDETLRARAVTELVRLTWVVLQRCRGAADPVAILRPWMSTIVAVLTAERGVEALTAVAGYIMRVSEGGAEQLAPLFRELGPRAEEAYVTIADQLEAMGLEQGLEQGRLQGQAALLRKQLALRFGALPERALTKLETAGRAELEQWAERVLTAASLDDVFGA